MGWDETLSQVVERIICLWTKPLGLANLLNIPSKGLS